MRLIDADVLKEAIKDNDNFIGGSYDIIKVVDAQPTVLPKMGKWIHISEEMWKCDQCGEISCCSPNFCPDCGSDMRQREE